MRDGALRNGRLIYVGAISAHDGVEGIAPVLGELCARHPDLVPHLTIVGDGDRRPHVESALRAHGVAERVAFTGWVPFSRVRELLLDADICADPAPATKLNELSTMVKLPEYLALGKPGRRLRPARVEPYDGGCRRPRRTRRRARRRGRDRRPGT
ncbi:MAG: glycosyltransferase family 4 protein [Solirubrobacterales bacterium]|nr:glycosyltransferase family 4 protein [Solirubrobacterales bacterium]